MMMFSSTASPGQRWKMFLPGAALSKCDWILNTNTASALIRGKWQSSRSSKQSSRGNSAQVSSPERH
jgi:hypothetical protein